MAGMRARYGLVTIALALGAGGLACVGSPEPGKVSATSGAGASEGSERLPRGRVACRLHSCSPPYFCNEESGLCEMIPCKASNECPYDYRCDFSVGACR